VVALVVERELPPMVMVELLEIKALEFLELLQVEVDMAVLAVQELLVGMLQMLPIMWALLPHFS
jgi:hypothetical protein